MAAEILLWVANAAGLLALVVPWRGKPRRLRHIAVLAPLAAGAQLLADGYRWPMVPAYALSVTLAVVWALGTARTGNPSGWLRALAIGVGTALFAVSVATPIAAPVFGLPQPGGPYAIGTVTYHWRDDARREIFDPDPAARRELMAQVWYPAESGTDAPTAPYVADAKELSAAAGPLLDAPGFVFDFWDEVPTHATRRPPVAAARPRYPVLVFASGLNAFRQSNMFQVERLVSHGFVVVGLDQPYTSAVTVFPDGRTIAGWTKDRVYPAVQQSLTPAVPAPALGYAELADGLIPYLARDIGFALDQLTRLNAADPEGLLTGRLDLERAGAFGVSLGAMTVGQACHTDPRLRACSMMDAAMPADVVRAGPRQPSMWLTRDAESILLERERSGGWPDREITETITTQREVFAASPPGQGYHVEIPGMFHVNFTDAPAWTPLAEKLGLSGPIGGARGHEIVAAYTLAFFERFLSGGDAALLDGPAPWREVRIERR
ncbi:alpha/beta hydrolase family protein [Nocardia rhamnosiphila]|uniref:alpha/beta hydrolase family protein n=1 Tax=Nocardia rhamnosiphila TaxID=426716 RepID=UPI0004C3D017|nr:carboxylic ester hydrolase [Nocardia rhamnosiphila]